MVFHDDIPQNVADRKLLLLLANIAVCHQRRRPSYWNLKTGAVKT